MGKILKENISDIRGKLLSKKSTERRSSAKKIGAYLLKEMEDDLYLAYLEEKKDPRTWETQCAMIKSLGKLTSKKIIPELEYIIQDNKSDDSITIEAALAYVRVTKEQKNDVSSIIPLLKMGKLSILNGAISALVYDGMVPERTHISEIVDILIHREDEITELHGGRGVMEPRACLLSALMKWVKKEPSIQYFIERCLNLETIKNNAYVIAKFKSNQDIYKE
ncbi:hypothetical protein ACV3J7_23335 [Salmonella enterica]|nr:hypothetical protein [Salmonella enterica subsp. enterica]